MANDNVKIIIQEVNQTQPNGSGASSDVAYVPGFAIEKWMIDDTKVKQVRKLDEFGNEIKLAEYDENGNPLYEMEDWKPVTNTPVLCSSVEEFESYFGNTPYILTEDDVYGVNSDLNVKSGDYDKSYIYAKELLNAGMSVVYENISPDKTVKDITLGVVNPSEFDKLSGNNVECSASTSLRTVKMSFDLAGAAESGRATITFTSDKVTVKSLALQESAPAELADLITIATDKLSVSWKKLTPQQLSNAVFNFEVEIPKSTASIFSVEAAPIVGKINNFYNNLSTHIEALKDKNEYSVKYITTGGYPSFVKIPATSGYYADSILSCAYDRGDSVALIDHADDPSVSLLVSEEGSVYYKANTYFKNDPDKASFGAMFTPWARYSCSTVTDTTKMLQLMPASFGYLMCVARAIKTSPNWLAMAGVTRGLVPNIKSLHTNALLSNVIAENYQPKFGKNNNNISINAITNVKPYGLTIWGNRTLRAVSEKGTDALNFLNTRNMVSDIKKLAYSTAKSLMFEQESDTLWLNFKSGVSPLLDQLKSGHGISDYKIIKGTTKYNGQALTKGEMAAVIKIYPLYAIEYFEITVVIADNDVAVQ